MFARYNTEICRFTLGVSDRSDVDITSVAGPVAAAEVVLKFIYELPKSTVLCTSMAFDLIDDL